MSLKNENSKIYFLIPVFSMIVIITGIMIFVGFDTINNFKLFDIFVISWGFSGILEGTKKLVAENNKKGYLDYCITIFLLFIFYETQKF